jgi:hypothetical protein
VWPSELDLMAKLAGMDLRERWADWSQTPFTADSTSHVSVWQKPHGQGVQPRAAAESARQRAPVRLMA